MLKDISLFASERKKKKGKKMAKQKIIPEWNVYIMDFNEGLKRFNVFNSVNFLWCLTNSKKEARKKEFKTEQEKYEWWESQIKSAAMYSFWAKAEYEITITDSHCMITPEEQQRIAKLEAVKYCAFVNLKTANKIDVYEQLCLNWDKFVEYVVKNLNNIQKVA